MPDPQAMSRWHRGGRTGTFRVRTRSLRATHR
jgi:hypothetical protein